MGFSLEFLVGPPEEILNALTVCNFDELDKLTIKKADFSLHLQPKDLQLLFDCVIPYTSQYLKPFRTALVCYLDEVDRGYFLINDDWVDAMASVDINISQTLTAQWFEKMAGSYPKEQIGKPTAEAEQAVCDIIELCKFAVQSQRPVIHIWIA